MNISGCSFNELSYSTLFKTYLTNFEKLSSFYTFNPLDEKDVIKRANTLSETQFKEGNISALADFHQELGIAKGQQAQLKKLGKQKSLAVITGQQLGVYGGPVFTIYKTITAILMARKYEKILERPVVPVFWLADEDHDFAEISWAGITGRDDFHKIILEGGGNGNTVAGQQVSQRINTFKQEINKELFETDFTAALWAQLDKYYQPDKTHAQAFAGLLNDWFSGEGLLIAGSNFGPVKKLISSEFQYGISASNEIFNAIETKSVEIEKSYHRQVMNGNSNLFYLSGNGRIKIHKEGDNWRANDKIWTEKELLAEIEKKPDRFSPNVFLRPIIQDKLLPTLGYVAGPGELAYFGQMKNLYYQFDLEMPPIIPRLCGTLVESGIARIKEKLPFKFSEYDKRIEDLESEYIERTETADIEKVFSKWKEKLDKAAAGPLKVINEIDPTLDGTVGKTVAGFANELDKLKGRIYRSIKKQEEIQIRRIEKIKVNLFPDSGLQERSISSIYFMNKYGLDIWKKLLKEIEQEGLDLTKHHLIEL